MATLTISLPDPLREFIDEEVLRSDFPTASAYLQSLIRRDKQRAAFRQMILDGIESGRGGVIDGDYWEAKRAAVAARAGGGQADR